MPFMQWRITIKSDDTDANGEGKIRYEEPFGGTTKEAAARARLMWARTSYIVPNANHPNNKRYNRDVYVLLEVMEDREYVKVWEYRGKLPVTAPAPSAA